MTDASAPAAKTVVLSPDDAADLRQAVATFVAAGADESIQRVTTAVHRLSRRLNQWYDRQLADLDLSHGEWAVLSRLATVPEGTAMTPSQLADLTNVAASSMTHRLDRMVDRGWIIRQPDPTNRTRVLVELTNAGYQLYVAAIRDANLVEGDVLHSLSPTQVEQLAALLETVIAGLDDAGV